MKKWFSYSAIFLFVYLIFVVATLPAQFVLAKVTLPKGVSVFGVSGSIWKFQIRQINFQKTFIEDIDIEVSLWSIFTFDPQLDIAFGDAMLPGPEGSLTISGLGGDLHAENINLNVSADLIAQFLPSPIPLVAHNYVSFVMDEFHMGKPVCETANGVLTWSKASVTALDETVELGKLSAKVNCVQGALALDVEKKNNLGLTFTVFVRGKSTISGNGYLLPGATFPEKIKPLLTFMGNADNKGGYRLRF